MFNLFDNMGSLEQRMVDRYEEDDLLVSTVLVYDAELDYETAVGHPEYNDGELIIVEAYATLEEAKAGHKNWVKIMTSDTLPDKLIDHGLSDISMLMDQAKDGWRVYPRKPREE